MVLDLAKRILLKDTEVQGLQRTVKMCWHLRDILGGVFHGGWVAKGVNC